MGNESYPTECSVCEKFTSRRCSICHNDYYCSTRCEDNMTIPHLFVCGKRSITTADYLYWSCGEDEMPKDEDVLRDFGFNTLDENLDKSSLLGLYKGLRLSHVSPKDIDKWRIEGSLAANIIRIYHKMPEQSRGRYFPWFLEHATAIFRDGIDKEWPSTNFIPTFFDEARAYLDEEDRIID